LDEQAAELEADRVLWYRRRGELETECRERELALEASRLAVEVEQKRREDVFKDAAAAVDARMAECDKRESFLAERDERTHAEWEKTERQRAELDLREQELAAR